MKAVWICACALLLVTAAGFAEAPSQPPLSVEAFAASLARPAAGSACATRASRALPASEGVDSACTATASCGSSTLYCEGDSSCSAVDRDCTAYNQGHVTCDGVTTFCPTECNCSGPIAEKACCRCVMSPNCYDCCRCDGGSVFTCSQIC